MADSLNTVESGKEDHLGITICRNSLDVFPQLLQDLFSVLLISLSLSFLVLWGHTLALPLAMSSLTTADPSLVWTISGNDSRDLQISLWISI